MLEPVQTTPARYIFFTFEVVSTYVPAWGLEDKYRAELTASDVRAALVRSKTNAVIISTGELATLEAALIHSWRYESDYTDLRGTITFVPQAGSPSFEAGIIGNGVRVTPSAGNLLATGLTAAVIDGGGSFTAAGWAKANQASSSWSILYAITVSPFANVWLLDNNFAQNEAEFYISDGGGAGNLRALAPYVANVGAWVFMCGVYDAADESSKLYLGIDGAALVSYEGAPTSWIGPRDTGHDALRAGYFTVGDVTLDEGRIWNEPLTPTLVDAVYQEGLAA